MVANWQIATKVWLHPTGAGPYWIAGVATVEGSWKDSIYNLVTLEQFSKMTAVADWQKTQPGGVSVPGQFLVTKDPHAPPAPEPEPIPTWWERNGNAVVRIVSSVAVAALSAAAVFVSANEVRF